MDMSSSAQATMLTSVTAATYRLQKPLVKSLMVAAVLERDARRLLEPIALARVQAHATMPRKTTKETTVTTSRATLMSMVTSPP